MQRILSEKAKINEKPFIVATSSGLHHVAFSVRDVEVFRERKVSYD